MSGSGVPAPISRHAILRRGVLAGILALSLISISTAAPAPALVVGLLPSPPWSQEGPGGQPEGLDVDILRAIEPRLGVRFEYRIYPWKRCLALLEQGKIDLIARFNRTTAREQFARYVTPAYSKDRILLLVKEGSGIDLRTHEDLSGLRIGVLRGNAHTARFDGDPTLERTTVGTTEQLLKMLAAGRIDVAVVYERAGLYRRALLNLDQSIRISRLELVRTGADHFAFSRRSRHQDLAPRFGTVLEEMLKSGEIETVLDRSFERAIQERSRDPRRSGASPRGPAPTR